MVSMRVLLLLVLFVHNGFSFAQDSKEQLRSSSDKARATMENSVGAGAYDEQLPSYPGGTAGMAAYVQREVHYPEEARDAGITGKVIVGFVIERDGTVDSVRVKRGVHPALDQEAVRVVGSMTGWTPGTMKGKPVPVQFTLPINFVIPEKELARIRRKLARKN